MTDPTRRLPITRLLWWEIKAHADTRRELVAAWRALDAARAELAVQQARTARWRRAAHEMAAGNERAMRLVEMQADSDDIADLPQVGDR